MSSWVVLPASASLRMPPFVSPCRRQFAGSPASVASQPLDYFEALAAEPHEGACLNGIGSIWSFNVRSAPNTRHKTEDGGGPVGA